MVPLCPQIVEPSSLEFGPSGLETIRPEALQRGDNHFLETTDPLGVLGFPLLDPAGLPPQLPSTGADWSLPSGRLS